MLPDEREYRVGPRGYVTERDGVTTSYDPGSLVWLRIPPPSSADLQATGNTRKYETKRLAFPRRQRGPSEELKLKPLPDGINAEQFMDTLGPTVEFTFEGFYDDMEAP